MKTILLSIVVLLLCFLLLGVRVLFDKSAKFPTERHHHANAPTRQSKRNNQNQPK